MPSEDNVQILKESKARFEGVIFNQTADLGTNKSTSCKVIDEATGEVIAQSGGGGGGDSDLTTAEVTVVIIDETLPFIVAYGAFIISENDYNFTIGHTRLENGSNTIVLYKEKAILFIENTPENLTITASGSAEIDNTDPGIIKVTITGDCTLTATVTPGTP